MNRITVKVEGINNFYLDLTFLGSILVFVLLY